MSTLKKVITWVIVGLILAAAVFIYFRFYFVFGDGVKAGELNQFTYKGYVWKTYEGRLIQAGFKGSVPKTGGTATIQSYIFDFSVADEEIANELMRSSGKVVEVHYKEYLGALPWRGMQKHVVDKIISVTSPEES
ncbi:MAG: hypothetical protein IJ840_04840 [Bacteroidales bacterium]|nr:hypothetical protein [Bacteroidales bacterium]MBR1434168.1 hypothetical protein [Bacteroidales bacterium]MBR1927061.1 hypothetical protein [Bacteroidales bacterium]